jgi:hypothetical protein
MNIEKFHNELAMRLGYERIVKDKRILISVDDSDDLWVTLKVQGHDDICFKASDSADDLEMASIPEMQNEIRTIIDAAHQAYIKSVSDTFAFFANGIR